MNLSETRKYEMSATMERSDVYFMKITESKYSIPFHWHNGIEIICNLSGKIWVSLKDRTIELNEGEFFLINIGTLHATKSTPGNIGILLELPSEFLKKYIPDVESCYYDINPHTRIRKSRLNLTSFTGFLQIWISSPVSNLKTICSVLTVWSLKCCSSYSTTFVFLCQKKRLPLRGRMNSAFLP